VQVVAFIVEQLSAAALEFLRERHLATFTSLRADGTPHVVAVGFSWDAEHGLARVITDGSSQKVHNAARRGPVVLSQVDGARWISLEGISRVSSDPEEVADAVARYAVRYRRPRVNPTRVVVEVAVTRILGSTSLLTGTRPTD
jgi:PPOX class probable F420-dependent enzyme